MKKALMIAPAVAIMAACGGDDAGDAGMAGDTLGVGTGTTTGTYTDPAVGTGTTTMPGDTMGMGTTGTGMPGDTMGMDTVGMGAGTGAGTGTGTTPP